jgi:hypothetical protein
MKIKAKRQKRGSGAAEFAEEHGDGVVEFVHDALFHGDDGVVRDVDFLGANFGAALGDVAQPDAEFLAGHGRAVDAIQRVHVQRGGANEKARAAEFVVEMMLAEDVANVLAKKTFDALAEFLDAVHVALLHFPFDAGARSERRNFRVHFVIPADIGDEILDERERFHRVDDDWLVERERIHASLAGEARAAVDFSGAGAAFGGFAIPADGEVGRLMRLNGMKRVEDHHAFRQRDLIIHGSAAVAVAAEDSDGYVGHFL